MRHIILHNHLFKNAGTSVEHILQQNFQDRWLSREFPMAGQDNTDLVAQWITDNPRAVAFSSHTMIGPLPKIDDAVIIPLMLLRDPIDRIASAYRFERIQQADTQGARLAKAHGFAGYVHARLSVKGDRQCRNFQTSRLAALTPDAQGSELERACIAIQQIIHQGVLGFVPEFDRAMRRLNALVVPLHPSFRWQSVTANAAGRNTSETVSPDMRQLLQEANQDDLSLLRFAKRSLCQTPSGMLADHFAGMV